MSIERFLNFLYMGYDETFYFCVATKTQNSFKTHFFQLSDKQKAIDLIHSSCDSNVYLSLNPYKSQQRNKENCVDLICNIFLDFDNKSACDRFVKQYSKYCTIVMSSPGKFQVVMKLKNPIHKSQAEIVSKALATKYHADHAYDCTRLIRCPFTWNRKYDPPVFSTVIQYATHYLPTSVIQENLKLKNQTNCLILPKPNQTNCLIPLTEDQKNTAKMVYERVLTSTPQKKGNPCKDYSIADMKFVVYLLSQNYPEQEIAAMLFYVSPDLESRKGKNYVMTYIFRTIEAAKRYVSEK